MALSRASAARQWWVAYNAYLDSPEWRQKRQKVLARSPVCEGCGDRRAQRIHHLKYPQGCLAGSRQWAAQEKLFDLRAVCRECHNDIHAKATA